MLPATLQFIIARIAYAINERLQRKLDYAQVEVGVLKEVLSNLGHRRIPHHRPSTTVGDGWERAEP